MRLSDQERAERREAFSRMSLPEKAGYIFAYYKLPLVLVLIAMVAATSVTVRVLSHKDPVLYVAFAGMVVPTPVEETLTEDYLLKAGYDPGRQEIVCYRELYLSREASLAEHEYAYASRLKLMASVESGELDVVFMNDEAFDILSADGYLLDLGNLIDNKDLLRERRLVLSTNQVEVDLGEASELKEETKPIISGIEVTGAPKLEGFSAGEPLYAGIISNTGRKEAALDYLEYVIEGVSSSPTQ